MLVQVGLESEGLIAALASVVLEGRVCLHVGAEVGAVSEGFATVGTGEGLLPRVRAHVALQQPRPAERLAAHVALVLEVVGQDVHGQRRHGHVHLPARGTLAGHLAVQAAVRLLVSAEVGRGGVRLAALVAGVSGHAPGPLRGHRAGAGPGPRPTVGVALPPGPPVRDEEGIHGVALGRRVRLAAVVAAGRHAGLRAVGLLEVRVAVLLSSAHLTVQRVRHRRRQLVLQLLLPLVYRWCDVILDVAIFTEADTEARHGVCDGASESEGVVQVLMVIRRREIIKLDLLHQK